ncbi:MAG: toxin-antitoxin system YwqK family antitoxin [Cyclobacteriaceae bacterium]|nr:toxin-antitoxin system YwqK family antitoxin [Cyclobacteriaceae bacterium]MDH4298021.1 toxin-antitoxin system YwqK family antitoxin [Cyclobacteriaceae bacterium]MDH5249293.1 toxin-antitoxin system YwqK family antitoxin [Cyclobacteriaceae bacterium]
MRFFELIVVVFLASVTSHVFAQGLMRQTYHDPEKKKLKEVYQVQDTIRNIPHGRYISYYLNGNVESKGLFDNNETSGIWEFYYETGKLKMRGILFKGANYGMWEYFFESGQKSMEGIIYGKMREGEWKTYYENGQVKEVGTYENNKHVGPWKTFFEDGALKGEIEYADDFGRHTEYYHSGKIQGEGPQAGTKKVGFWRYFAEDGTLQSEGEYTDGRKNGYWTDYYPSGKPSLKGSYINDKPSGKWEYYFEDGTLSSTGDFDQGKKDGYWKAFSSGGKLKSEVTFDRGSGEYREYYESGKLKLKGLIVDDRRQGTWEFFFEDGRREGTCEYDKGKGTYYGYYPSGTLQTKGALEDDLKVGTWELYENDGKLSGYYRPYYDNRELSAEISDLANKSNATKKKVTQKKGFTYFDPRFNEFQGVIFGTNPVWLAAGELPLGIEFYLEERIGHEFEFIGIRDPFFKADQDIAPGKQFRRGYSIAIKQKFYNPLRAGMWYFGQEIRFTNLGHFVNQNQVNSQNPDDIFTFNAVEQRIEWGALLGYRIMRRNDAKGFTIDVFISGDIGYRGFDVDPEFAIYFKDLNQDKFSRTFHFGLNLGNVFSFQ